MKYLKNQLKAIDESLIGMNAHIVCILYKVLNVVKKNTQIKIAIKMLVRNDQTLEEISEIVGLDLNALRELKKSI